MFVNRFIYLISNICNYHIITNLRISEQCDKYQKWQNSQTILWNANHKSTLPFRTFEQTFFLCNIFCILCNIIFSPESFAEVQTKTVAIQILGQLNKKNCPLLHCSCSTKRCIWEKLETTEFLWLMRETVLFEKFP